MEKMVVGELGANCYIIASEQTQKGIVIDPGGNGEEINEKINSLNLDIQWIINTHGHVDHIGANAQVKAFTGAKLGIHKSDASMLTNPEHNLSAFTGAEIVSPEAEYLLQEGDFIEAEDLKLEVLHTPGHTPGSICLRMHDKIFTGDTLFYQGIGRCDLPGGDQEQLVESVQNKLFVLENQLAVYPGHGEKTTIGEEKEKNPFFSSSMEL